MIANPFKRIYAPGIRLRLIALLCLAVGIMVVWFWDSDSQTTRILVHLPPQRVSQEPIINRNLSEFESGGRFETCNYVRDRSFKKCVDTLDQARDFIWRHWKEKKRGYIIYDFSGTDTMNEFHFFIEPDEFGKWRVVQRWKEFSPPPNPLGLYEIKEESASFIKRRPNTKDDGVYEPGKYYLIFLDQHTEQIDTL
jgi:hypothetical protein